MGEGNIFTGVCHSVHRREACIQDVSLPWMHPSSQEEPPPPGFTPWMSVPLMNELPGLHPRCTSLWMHPLYSSGCTRPPHPQHRPEKRWSTGGRCAFYWKAYLFISYSSSKRYGHRVKVVEKVYDF